MNADSRSDTRIMAVFCDFENVALGVRDVKIASFDIRKVLERLLLKGNIVVKKAYCNWERYQEYKRPMHEAAFELIEIPHVRQSGKNSADIRMVVDALDLCYTKEHVDTFVVISGDSDFSPLVASCARTTSSSSAAASSTRPRTSSSAAATSSSITTTWCAARAGRRSHARRRSRNRRPRRRRVPTTGGRKASSS